MRFLVRLVVAGIGLYILLKLGLIELFMITIMMIGKEVYRLAMISPVAAAIGILLVIVMSGKGLIDRDNHHHRRH